MRIIQDYIPKGRLNRPGHALQPLYITVHNTANTAKTANAAMHARYVKSPTTTASWHFTVDDCDVIYQHLPLNENGWHAGDGNNGKGNRQSIGIEICEYAGIDEAKANDNAIWLIRRLMTEFNIPITKVVPHKHWSGKNCPRKLIGVWPEFIAKILAVDSVVVPPSIITTIENKASSTTISAKPVAAKTVSIVDYLNANGVDSSFANRAKLAAQYGIRGYSGTAAQNIELLAKVQGGKPGVVKPTPAPKKPTVHLPASAKTWRTYKLNVQPVAKNSDWSLTPSAFGGLTYEILGKPYADVVTVETSRGKRNIYVGKGTGAIIK